MTGCIRMPAWPPLPVDPIPATYGYAGTPYRFHMMQIRCRLNSFRFVLSAVTIVKNHSRHVERAYIIAMLFIALPDNYLYLSRLLFGMAIAPTYREATMPTSDTERILFEPPVAQCADACKTEKQTWPLKIYTLGRFGLVLDGEPLHFSGKMPRKPLELLKALIACGGRGVSEEQLIDYLWPDTDPSDATRSFSSALHRLRGLLGYSRFILRQNRQITLDQNFCWVDAWTFERLSKQAQRHLQQDESEQPSALQTAHQAINHYSGHFLPADVDQQWSISMRERLRFKMVNLITMVGQHWEAANDWSAALAIYQKGLETDDLYEDFYQRQMICHCQLGNHGEATSVYNRCRYTLAMLGVTPSSRTITVYEEAISSKKKSPDSTL